MLGAAGGIESVFTALSVRDQIAPPTINLHNPSPECDLDYVPLTATENGDKSGTFKLVWFWRYQCRYRHETF